MSKQLFTGLSLNNKITPLSILKRKTITYYRQCTLIPRFAVSAGLGDSLRFEKIKNKIMNSFYWFKLLEIFFISSFFLLKLFHAVYSVILICTSTSCRFCCTDTVLLYRDTSTKILIVCVCRLSCSVFSCSVRFCDVLFGWLFLFVDVTWLRWND